MEEPSATIRAIQARNYRSLRHVDFRFEGHFYVLAGPSGSGKSTPLDAIAFLTDCVEQGLERAVGKRTRNFQDLVWGRAASSRRPSSRLGIRLGATSCGSGKPARA